MGASQSSSSNNNSSSDITRNNDASASSLTSTTFTTSSSSAKNTDRQLQQQLSEPAADVDMPTTTSDILMTSTPPPQLGRMESFDEKLWRKFSSQPLIPIGCATTAYFLASGIRAFQKRDPVRSQRMMRNRIAAQFVTLACFIGYIGVDQADFRFAPMYQEKLKAQQQEQAAAEAAAAASTTADKD